MERSIKVLLTILALSLCPCISTAELFVKQDLVVWNETSWDIRAAYQVGSEVWVIHMSGVTTPTVTMASNVLDVGCPSLVVTMVRSQYDEGGSQYAGAVKLYSISEGHLATYDPEIGNGYIYHDQFGWCYVRHYPWVWSWDEYEWEYFATAGQEAFDLPDNTWWVWSESKGWCWIAEHAMPWCWSPQLNDWTTW